MKAPKKVITAMAIATLLGGTAAPAFAAQQATFEPAGKNVEGINIQTTTHQVSSDGVDLTGEGEVKINGTFNKTISAIPVPVTEGNYLRVTMPIKVDFTYDVDNDRLTSPDIKVVNESVQVTGEGEQQQRAYKSVKMTLTGLTQGSVLGTSNNKFEFVEGIDKASSTDKIQLPFEILVEGEDLDPGTYSFKKLNDSIDVAPIIINAQDSVTLKMGQIRNQGIWNKEKITEKSTTTSHGLKMKFEYQK